ncbi:MAG: iron-sulfur cluster assembly protein [Myxococcota bacterium]
MHGSEEVTFARETQVVLIPDGVPQVLPEGTRGWITQVLGGNYTVQLETGRLVRVGSADVDAIGREASAAGAVDPDAPVTPERVWEVLRSCYDPEIPLNIVELGLIYELMLKEHAPVEGEPDGVDGVDVDIVMTLTAPGCGMGQVLADDVQSKVRGLPGVAGVNVQLTFDPPWSPERMSEEGRLELGMFY